MAEKMVMIPMPLLTLNQYIEIERGNRFGGAAEKKRTTTIATEYTLLAMRKGVRFDWGKPLRFDWFWYDRRTDPDNIAFQHKFVFDGMMAAGFLTNDNWDNIVELRDRFFIDKANPRVEVYELDE
nr:endodeoxyribonuclease [Lacticaseibacillus sp. 53-4]